MLAKVQISDPGPRHAPLPASALRRHAAARRDRDGAGQGPDAADPRRADDGPRRDGGGRGARSDRQPPEGVRHERPVHQPQPRRHPQDVRAGRRPLRRTARRGGPDRDAARRPAPSVHRGPASLHPPWRPAQGPRPARHHPRVPAPARRAPPRLRLRRPLPDRDRPLPHGRAAAPPARRRPLEPVPLPRAGRLDTSCDAAAREARADETNGSAVLRLAHDIQDVPSGGAERPGARGHRHRRTARRDAGSRRRVGKRQDDARPCAARAHGARRGLHAWSSTARRWRPT